MHVKIPIILSLWVILLPFILKIVGKKSLHETVIVVKLNLPNHIALFLTSNIFPVKKSKVIVDRWELLCVCSDLFCDGKKGFARLFVILLLL